MPTKIIFTRKKRLHLFVKSMGSNERKLNWQLKSQIRLYSVEFSSHCKATWKMVTTFTYRSHILNHWRDQNYHKNLNKCIRSKERHFTLGPVEKPLHRHDIEAGLSVEGPIVEKFAASELGFALVTAAMRVQPPWLRKNLKILPRVRPLL